MGYKNTAYQKSHQEDMYGPTKSPKTRQNIFVSQLENGGQKRYVRLSEKTRNDTAYGGLDPYYLLLRRP